MTLLTRSLLIALMVSSGATTCAAQVPPPPPPVAPTKTVGKARVYRSGNVTAAKSGFFRREKFSMSAVYEVADGQRPAAIRIFFQSFSRGLRYKDNRQLIITSDGKSTLKSEAESKMSSCDPKGSGECYELLLSPPLPYADFLRILKSKKVSVTLGADTWDLTPEEMEGLRDLDRSVER